MKAVMISIQPKWVEKIVSREKTIEVRKSRPKIETPFKCYIYMTRYKWVFNLLRKFHLDALADKLEHSFGKVIGEFVCDMVYYFLPCGLKGHTVSKSALKILCLTVEELNAYGGLKTLYGWHISNLKIYDKPREIGEFKHYCDGSYKTPKRICQKVKYYVENDKKTLDIWADCDCLLPLTRPPQSWCYVEEV